MSALPPFELEQPRAGRRRHNYPRTRWRYRPNQPTPLSNRERVEMQLALREQWLHYVQSTDEAFEHIRLARIRLGRFMVEARRRGVTGDDVVKAMGVKRSVAYEWMKMAADADDGPKPNPRRVA